MLDAANKSEGASHVVLLIPVGTPGFRPYKNSLIRECPGCKKDCYVGPAQQEYVRSGVPMLCGMCVARKHGPAAAKATVVALTRKRPGE